jgi:hypothetical protein
VLFINTFHSIKKRLAPIVSDSQKLSKIETLRLAKNYIKLLSDMLNDNPAGASASAASNIKTANVLTPGLSQATVNVIHSLLGINRRSSISIPMRASATNDNFVQDSESPRSKGAENSAYRLNDLLTVYHQCSQNQESQTPISEEDQAQLDSLVNLLNQEQDLLMDDANSSSWTGQDTWDSSSFDFDDPPTDF